jgi:cytochrome c553
MACGYCHLPNGQGRPENAALAGLPSHYIAAQLADMKSGARHNLHPGWRPAQLMSQEAGGATTQEVAAAADYFSNLVFTSRVRVVESATIPHATAEGAVYRFATDGAREPLGQRIVEGPEDFSRFELRDDRVGYVAYVPPGAILRGRTLATSGGSGRTQICATCHGGGLRGALGPPLAGRSPSYLFRQLAAFRAGARHGANGAPMKNVTAKLGEADMVDLAAYAGSLQP